MSRPCVYILANEPNGTLYVGVTNDLAQRVWEHKCDVAIGFTKQHAIHTLVYAEFHDSMADATIREKRIKRLKRAEKLALIEQENPEWRDLYEDILA